MTCKSDHARRWIDVALGRTTKSLFAPGRSNVYATGDRIYSYGQHFEMGRPLRDAKGRAVGFLLNGDRYSVTTSQHQATVRQVVSASGLPSVIIPHSALSAAGVDLNTVQTIEALPDRFETTPHSTTEMPEGASWRDIEIRGYVPLSKDEIAELVVRKNEERKSWGLNVPTITEADLQDYELRQYRVTGTRRALLFPGGGEIEVEVSPDGATRYSWETSRHWLGESVVRAKVQARKVCSRCKGQRPAAETCGHCRYGSVPTTRWATFLSGFDHNETRAVYFFCELPRGAKPTTVAEAYESLKPEPVKLAEQMGRTVHRQGDIFAIELTGLNKRELSKAGARFEKRGNLLGTNHEATEVAYLPDGNTLVRGTLWHSPSGRDPDHKRVTVGKSWHLAIKNTVPLSK